MTQANEALQKAEKATEGPWCWHACGEKDNSWYVGVAVWPDGSEVVGEIGDQESERWNEETGQGDEATIVEAVCENSRDLGPLADADFIAAARTDVPLLARLVLDLAAENEALRKERDAMAIGLDTAIRMRDDVERRNARLDTALAASRAEAVEFSAQVTSLREAGQLVMQDCYRLQCLYEQNQAALAASRADTAKLTEALIEAHEMVCGCEEPGSIALCVAPFAPALVSVAALLAREGTQ